MAREKVKNIYICNIPNSGINLIYISDPLRAQVLELYMKNFDFSRQRIDTAFRTLCFKLYFRAESQKLDRILESFAQHYYRCNPTTILHSADIVYAIAYSLLLLNTDLYVSQDSKMMTRQHFVKNTLATVQSLTCPSTSSSESSLSTKNSKDYAFGSIKRRSHLVQQITNYIISPDQKIWLAEIENLLKVYKTYRCKCSPSHEY